MKSKFIQRLKGYLRTIRNKTGRKLFAYLVCVMIASVFWFLDALSKDYNTVVTLPVRFVNPPQNKILVSDMPDRLSLRVNGYGFSLLRYKMKLSLYPLTFDLSDFSGNTVDQGTIALAEIKTDQYISQIGAQLSSDVRVQSIEPEALYLRFEATAEKKVPVIPSFDLETERQFEQFGAATAKPAYVVVKGPVSKINALKAIYTEYKSIQKANRNIQYESTLNLAKNLSCRQSKIEVTIPVEQVTESKLYIPVQVRNIPPGYDLKIFPSHITLTCMLPLSQFPKIHANNFTATVDYNLLKENKDLKKLPVLIENKPSAISHFSYSPLKVEYLIEKR